MKQRIISAIIAFVIAIPIFLLGGIAYKVGIIILSFLAIKELMNIKKKDFPFFMKIVSYVILLLLLIIDNKYLYKSLSLTLLVFMIPIIFCDKKSYNIEDAFFMMAGILILSFSFRLLIFFRIENMYLLIYLILISITTDTYAYIVGMLFGKHKLIERISPKKTWEGSIGGTALCLAFCTLYYQLVIGGNIYMIIITTLVLSILGQLGDLFFSAIKRYYNKKDFSNIMPGHGGILDRFDSTIFVLLGYILFF